MQIFSSGSLRSRFWLLENKHEIICGKIQPLFRDDAAIVRGLFDVPDVLQSPPGNPGFAKALVESLVGRGREAAIHFEGAVNCGKSLRFQKSRCYLREALRGRDRRKMEHIDGNDDIVKPFPFEARLSGSVRSILSGSATFVFPVRERFDLIISNTFTSQSEGWNVMPGKFGAK